MPTRRPSFAAWTRRNLLHVAGPFTETAEDICHDYHWPEGPGSLGAYEQRFREGGADDDRVDLLRQVWEQYTTAVGDPRSPFVPVGELALAAVLRDHPQLNDGGYGRPRLDGCASGERPDLVRVQAAARWIRSCIWAGRGHWSSSYHLKHVMEHETGVYVSNGSFVAAALIVGVPIRLSGYNPGIGIRLFRGDLRPGNQRTQCEWSVKAWARDDPGRGHGLSAADYAAGADPIWRGDDAARDDLNAFITSVTTN